MIIVPTLALPGKVAKKYRVLPEAWWTPSPRLPILEAGIPAWGTNHAGEE
jgi:hypothetical protein